MKKYIPIISVLLLILNSCNPKPEDTTKINPEKNWRNHGSRMKLDGVYTGKNLYIQNPLSAPNGFCITEKPSVNGSESTALVSSSAFEIDLKSYNLKIGDSVHIVIIHHDNCNPKVLNPEAIGLTVNK